MLLFSRYTFGDVLVLVFCNLITGHLNATLGRIASVFKFEAHVPQAVLRPCVFVWNGSCSECSVLIGCLFSIDNFKGREIHAMHSG